MSGPIEPRLSPCGCCEGGVHVPDHVNPPGLPAVRYRIGTHPDFLARMKARIHAWELLGCAECERRFVGPDRLDRVLDHIARAHPTATDPSALVVAHRPLGGLGTRAGDDPAIALMDAWAVVGDVVTFYQERIANESWLRTATERRSVLELARAIGYELDPGVAAETYLAFTVDDAEGAPTHATIPAGTQVLSVPAGDDEVPQTFETAKTIGAHVDRNLLRPRLSHPLRLEPDLTHVVLAGTATGVRPGQRVLMLIDGSPTVRRVTAVSVDNEAETTRVDLAGGTAAPDFTLDPYEEAELDPAQDPLDLTRANVDTHVVRKQWTESDLQAFLTLHEWDADAVLAYVEDLRTASFYDPDRQLLAFRDRVGFFGHNAPYFASLPDLDEDENDDAEPGTPVTAPAPAEAVPEHLADVEGRRTDVGHLGDTGYFGIGGGTGKAWPYNWDGLGLSIWTDSLTNAYYDAPSGEDADVYLERAVPELVPDTWVVFDAPGVSARAYRVTDASDASRTGFGLSGKVSGLELADGDGSALANTDTDKPADFHFRRTTASVRSEAVAVAALPLTDDLEAGTTTVRLDTMVLGLEPGRPVILSGEEVGTNGTVRSERLVVEAITHSAGYTTLELEDGLTRGYVRDTVAINANVVRASHGETVPGEVLGSGDGAASHQRFTLAKPPLTHLSTEGGSEAELTVRVDRVAWQQVDTLYGLGAGARAYVVRIDDDANATILFGDGRSGARLPTGQENVTATYRSGVGAEGEVGAGSLTLLKTRPFGIREVTNPLAASGADDPEKLADARTNAPLTVLTLDRIVSLQDYEDYARAYPGIGKARADVVTTPAGEAVHVTVADADGDAVGEPLYGRLLASIEAARDPLMPVTLASYQPFIFFVVAKLLRDQAYRWEDVAADATAALKAAFGFDSRSFAQPVTAAEVLQVLHGVDGVLAVDLDELYKTAPDATPPGTLFNAVLESHPAKYDEDEKRALPAELLLIHELGIELSEMTP